jgi:hypothetical protein
MGGQIERQRLKGITHSGDPLHILKPSIQILDCSDLPWTTQSTYQIPKGQIKQAKPLNVPI